jgi:hypothetical protein
MQRLSPPHTHISSRKKRLSGGEEPVGVWLNSELGTALGPPQTGVLGSPPSETDKGGGEDTTELLH